MKLFASVTHPLSFPVLFYIFRMAFPVLFEVSRGLFKPLFDPRIIIAMAIKVSFSPFPVVICLQGRFTGSFSTGLLALTDFWVRGELGLSVRTFFHPGPPLNERNETNQTNQRTKMNKEESKGKNHILFSLIGIIGIIRRKV